jgi:hypothetical protein
MEGCSDPFLDNTIVAFGIWHMLWRICKVHVDSKIVKQCILEQLKSVVLSNLGDLESSFAVDCYNFLVCLFKLNKGLALDVLSSLVVYIF